MTATTKHKLSPRVSDEDKAWLAEQAESLGVDDEAAAISALVRWARKAGVTLAISSGEQPVQAPPRRWHPSDYRPKAKATPVAAEDVRDNWSDHDPSELASAGEPVDEDAIEAMVAQRVAEAERTGMLDLPPPEPAPAIAAAAGRVIPLHLNQRRGYLLGSTAIPGGG
jgi:hypothetical protein